MRRIEIITCPDCGRLCDVSITEGLDGTAVQQICMGCGEILDAQTVPEGEGYYLDCGTAHAADGGAVAGEEDEA